MKKFFFFVCIIISLFLTWKVFKIALVDLNNLTEYGWGYFVGEIILLLIFIFLSWRLFPKSQKTN
ncbi:hypothetical protein [uncultured Salegentibacter sp.]|uniref:hypothetical protein n=1 Tax=uncultured Salegentibacter sp. TaxID=259320 RepID=UPI0025916C16|nr:hypothetical protein [uncultured Salegentibacter sp.]